MRESIFLSLLVICTDVVVHQVVDHALDYRARVQCRDGHEEDGYLGAGAARMFVRLPFRAPS